MANQVYDPETEGQEPTYRSPDLGPGHNAPSGDSSDPRTIHKSPQTPPKEEAASPARSPSNLRDAESSGGGFFNSGGDSSDSLGAKGLAAAEGASSLAAGAGGGAVMGARMLAKNTKNFFWGSKKRKRNTIGGGAATVIIGGIIVGGSLLSGPFEFVHIAQLLQQFHFSTNQNESNDRVGRLMRYAHYAPQGDAYRTNLNYVGNRLADGVEIKLREQGLRSSYTPLFGLKDGYIIDRNNQNFKGLSDDEIAQQLREKYKTPSLEVTTITDKNGVNQLFMKQPSGYREGLGFYREVLREDGLGNTVSAIGARVMGTRDGVTWHPLKKLDNKVHAKIEERINFWNEERTKNIADGVPENLPAASDPKNTPGEPKAQQDQTAANATGAAAEGGNVGAQGDQAAKDAVSSGNPDGPLTSFTNSVHAKIAGGVVAAAGVLCMARGIAQNADEVKQKQVELPLARTGVRAVSEGNQVMSGQDIDINQLSLDSKQLTDSQGKSWYDAQSIQAEVGKTGQGVPPDDTLKTINKGSPLDFLVSGTPIADALGPVCSTAGIAIQTVVGFFGGPVSALAGFVGSAVLGPPIIDKISSYLAGQAVSLNPTGPKFGNYINYGSRLAANDQALSSGGRSMSGDEEGQLADTVNADYKNQFDQHGLAYRLFSPRDRMSLISSIMDRQTNNAPVNLTNMALATANVGHSLTTTFSNLLSGIGHAATPAPYDYGFPEIAYSQSEMDNPNVENPYANGDAVANILDNNGQNGEPDYISLVDKCFGDTIDQISVQGPNGGTNQVWDVKYGTDPVNIYSADYKGSSGACNSTSDSNWLKIRFFIFDTQNVKGLDCYQGDDQSCSEMGFDNSGGADTSGTDASQATVSGDAQQLAQQILDQAKAGKIIFNVLDSSDQNDGSTPEDNIKETANGQPAQTTSNCSGRGAQPPNATVQLNTDLLKFILQLSQQETIQINALAGQCHGETGSNHYQGKAVDFGCPLGTGPADSVGKPYNIFDGTGETCANASHYHYSVGGN